MKHVSFKAAKTLKGAGYPQVYFGHHYLFSGESAYGALTEKDFEAPTYLEVWLWLWKEKGIAIDIQLLSYPCVGWAFSIDCISTSHPKLKIYDSQEEAVIAAIEYLVDANLIK